MQWNIQGACGNYKNLQILKSNLEPDIILLNETLRNRKHKFNLKGYDIIRNNRDNKWRRNAILI